MLSNLVCKNCSHILQSIIPLVFITVPAAYCALAFLMGRSLERPVRLMISLWAVLPLASPLVTLLAVRTYRRQIFCVRRHKTGQSRSLS